MSSKKIVLIIILIAIVGGIVFVAVSSINKAQEQYVEQVATEEKIDIVVQENQYITQINDIYYNFDEYEGKTIQIEGFPMTYNGLIFVGRYGPGCCVNDEYACLEYEYSEEIELVDEKDWIRVIGTIEKGIDQGMEYIYIKATSVEKLETRGADRVTM